MRPFRFDAPASRHSRQGALTVEMALITPLLLTLIFGIMQLGYAFMVQHLLQDAARQGCRVGTLRSRSNQSITTSIHELLLKEGIAPSKTTITILVNNVAENVDQANAGDDVCVKVGMPLSEAALFPGFFSNFTGNLEGAVVLRCE